MALDLPSITAFDRDDIGLDDLRHQVIVACVAVSMCTPVVLMILFSRSGHTAGWVTTAMLAVYGTGFLTLFTGQKSTTFAAVTFLACASILLIGSLWIAPLAWLVYLTPLVVLFASTFFNELGGLAAAAAVTIGFVIVDAYGAPLSSDAIRIILVLTWANVIVARLASEPMRLALHWSWTEYQRAEREGDRARRQQGELVRIVKSLNLAQDRLEQMNHEMERARRAADEARRMKMEFAATISHELRTPLNLIIGFAEMMVADANGYVENHSLVTYQRDADTIYRNARHLSTLVDDILDLSQIDAARMGLVREPVQLAGLGREATSVVEALFLRKRLRLAVNIPEDLPLVSVDRARVRQVLINLLSNAARFTDEGSVTVSAWVEDGQVVMGVTDTGTGITEEDLPIIFEEFRQGSGAGVRKAGGSGLGLAISKRLIELHGGTMWVESHRGEGSTFYFTLPTCDNIASVPLRREWETWAPGLVALTRTESTVVVFDEDAEPEHLLRRYLDGHHVVGAKSIAEVHRLRKIWSVCAIVITLPDEAKMENRAQQLRTHFGDLPIVLCPLPGRRRLAAELGIAEYLVKPIMREQIARLLRHGGRLARDVLVIDDDPDFVDLLARLIQANSRRIRVRCCYGGAEALVALREARPDLVLLDLLMPHTDGYSVLEAIHADSTLHDIRIVVLTARGEQEETITANRLTLTRGSGLSLAELLRALKASVDVVSGETPSSERAPRGAPLGSQASPGSR